MVLPINTTKLLVAEVVVDIIIDKTGVGSLLNTVARRVDKPFEQIFVHAHL